MMLAELVVAAMLAALILYVLLGGADFGGGVWDLLASGPRAAAQRALIDDAIAPVWEANHVWLILVVVLLFTAFPTAFSAASIALHVPLTLMLIGIVLRGSAFVLRKYSPPDGPVAQRWGRVFAASSSITPLFLGVVVGALTAGRIRVVEGVPTTGFFRPWLAAFPWLVGVFTLALFSFLAAVYLTVEAKDERLREDFRRRAIGAGAAVGVSALVAALAAGPGTAHFRSALLGSAWSWPLQIATGLVATGAFVALLRRRPVLARWLAIAQVSLIVLGWGLAQHPYLIVPDVTITSAAAPDATLRLVLWALGAGGLVIVPSFYCLLWVFKRRPDRGRTH